MFSRIYTRLPLLPTDKEPARSVPQKAPPRECLDHSAEDVAQSLGVDRKCPLLVRTDGLIRWGPLSTWPQGSTPFPQTHRTSFHFTPIFLETFLQFGSKKGTEVFYVVFFHRITNPEKCFFWRTPFDTFGVSLEKERVNFHTELLMTLKGITTVKGPYIGIRSRTLPQIKFPCVNVPPETRGLQKTKIPLVLNCTFLRFGLCDLSLQDSWRHTRVGPTIQTTSLNHDGRKYNDDVFSRFTCLLSITRGQTWHFM